MGEGYIIYETRWFESRHSDLKLDGLNIQLFSFYKAILSPWKSKIEHIQSTKKQAKQYGKARKNMVWYKEITQGFMPGAGRFSVCRTRRLSQKSRPGSIFSLHPKLVAGMLFWEKSPPYTLTSEFFMVSLHCRQRGAEKTFCFPLSAIPFYHETGYAALCSFLLRRVSPAPGLLQRAEGGLSVLLLRLCFSNRIKQFAEFFDSIGLLLILIFTN